MSAIDFANLVLRQEEEAQAPSCETGNEYDGRIGLRVAALFIIWITSSIGAVFPVFAKRHEGVRVPDWVFFACKYFGSGVIIATAFIHLLGPAEEALTNPCLTGPITEYSWPEGIILMTIIVLFFVELMVMRYGNFGGHSHDHGDETSTELAAYSDDPKKSPGSTPEPDIAPHKDHRASVHAPAHDHHGHAREHTDIEDASSPLSLEDYKAQMTAIFILEFGIICKSYVAHGPGEDLEERTERRGISLSLS
jgi:solute carrier family 39 (zinc transporter), member 1/2/3